MKSFKKLLSEAKKTIDYSKLTPKDIDFHHEKLSQEEKTKFSEMISDESNVPILVQQRNALKDIHAARKSN